MTVILAERLILDHHVILVKYCYETLINVEIAADSRWTTNIIYKTLAVKGLDSINNWRRKNVRIQNQYWLLSKNQVRKRVNTLIISHQESDYCKSYVNISKFSKITVKIINVIKNINTVWSDNIY